MAKWNCNTCKKQNNEAICFRCKDGSEYIKQTNADKIRAMSDEELAEFLHNYVNHTCLYCKGCGSSCVEHNLKWLQSEAE